MTEPVTQLRRPRVAIGMPVFNGGATLAPAIDSLVHQTFRDFTLIISDNASTDCTQSVCERFANVDPRIEYIRQRNNIGAEANFDFVLQHSNADYFMWAAADDSRSPDFLELCVAFLDEHPDYAAATCATRYTGGLPDPIAMADYSLDDEDLNTNIINVFHPSGRLRLNSRFYSLFRRKNLSFWLSEPKAYLGSDWSLIIRTLHMGKFKRLDTGYTDIGRHGASKQLDIFKSYRSRFAHWFVPFLDLSRLARQALIHPSRQQKSELLRRLTCLNTRVLKRQLMYEIKLRLNAFLSKSKPNS